MARSHDAHNDLEVFQLCHTCATLEVTKIFDSLLHLAAFPNVPLEAPQLRFAFICLILIRVDSATCQVVCCRCATLLCTSLHVYIRLHPVYKSFLIPHIMYPDVFSQFWSENCDCTEQLGGHGSCEVLLRRSSRWSHSEVVWMLASVSEIQKFARGEVIVKEGDSAPQELLP